MSKIQFKINNQIFDFDPNSIMHRWKGQTKDKHCFIERGGMQIFVKKFEAEPPGVNYLSTIADKEFPNLPKVYKWYYDNSKNKYYLFQEALSGADTIQKNINADVVSIQLPSLISSMYKGLRAIHTQGFWHIDLVFKNILICPNEYAIIDIDSCRELSESIGGQNVIDTELSALLVKYKKQFNLKEEHISGDQYNLLQLLFIPLYLISYSKNLIINPELKFSNYAPSLAVENLPTIIPNYSDIFLAIKERTFSESTLLQLTDNISPYLYLNRYCIATNWPDKIINHELGPKILNFYKNLNLLIIPKAEKHEQFNENQTNINLNKEEISASILINGKKKVTIDEGDKVRISVSISGIKEASLNIEDIKGVRQIPIKKKEYTIEKKLNNNTRLTIALKEKTIRAEVKVRKKPNPIISNLTVNGRKTERLYIEKNERYLLTWILNGEAKGIEIDGKVISNKSTYIELRAPKKAIKHNIRAFNYFKGAKIYSQPIPLEVILKGITTQQNIKPVSKKPNTKKKYPHRNFSKQRANQSKKKKINKESNLVELEYFDYTPKEIKKGDFT